MSVTTQIARMAVFQEAGQPLELQSLESGELNSGEALVAIDCCTLCGSDLHSINGARKVPTPTVLGHEILGRLVEITEGVCDLNGVPLAIGDRVSWSIVVSCDECFFCRHGLPQKCESLFKYGHQPLYAQHPLSGGLATHCRLVRKTRIIKVPDQLSDLTACPANCATATVAAATRIAGGCSDQVVLICGAGMLGLTAAAMAQHQGARHVLVSDVDQGRARRALEFGATHIDLAELDGLTEGRGADVVFELSGSPDAVEAALQYVRTGGRLILAGSVFPGRAVPLHPEQIVRRMLRVEGLHNYGPEDLKTAMQFLLETHHQYPFHRLVEREFDLAGINHAVHFAQRNKPIRIAIRAGTAVQTIA